MNVLLTTSAAPSQSPFSTTEKRPPLGLGFLIAVLKEAGHKVFFIDNYLSPSDFLETDYLARHHIDFVGIYANTICFRDTRRMLHRLEYLRQTGNWQGKIIVGGPHTSVALNTIPAFVDFVVQGEGERAILDIVEGRAAERVLRRRRIDNLDDLPMPAWDYFINQPYNWGGDWFPGTPVFTMNTSRGCPFHCTFCSVGSIWGKKYTFFSAGRIVDDIDYLMKQYGARGIYFREDNFTVNRRRTEKFCELLIERDIKITWACETRVDTLDRELVELMQRAGLAALYFGVESGSQEVLNRLQKKITPDQTRAAFGWCREFGIKTAASVIVGTPGETSRDLQQTLALINDLKPTVTWFNVFVGIPQSPLYKQALDEHFYEFVDDRGLVYLTGHNDRVKAFYGGGWDAAIPITKNAEGEINAPKISVVMSVFNGASYLEEAITSILQQTFASFELIIVNDASTDATPEILGKFDDCRIRVITNPGNLGLTKSLNIGMEAARGKYIARMDADDISLPHRLELQWQFLEKHTDYALVGSPYYQMDEQGRISGLIRVLTGDADLKAGLKQQNWFGHGSVMMRREALQQVGGYDEHFTYAQDYDLWLRMSEHFHLANLEEPLYCWRVSASCISQSKIKEQEYFAGLARKKAMERENIGKTSCQSEITSASPMVSVIVPTYNRPEMLVQTIQSILDQTYKDHEIIVVNDCGLEVESIVAWLNQQQNITYVRHGRNRGLAAARNTGIGLARGKYLAYLDDDDLFYPDHLETLVTFLTTSDYRVAYTDALRALQVKKQGRYATVERELLYSHEFDADRLIVANQFPVLCLMHERVCLEQAGLFDESLTTHEDWDLWIRLSFREKFAHIKKITCEFSWRDDGSTMSSTRTQDFVRTMEIIYGKYQQHLRNKPHIKAMQRQFLQEQKVVLGCAGSGAEAKGVKPDELLARATIALDKQDWATAEGHLRELNRLFADLLEPYLVLSDILTMQGKHQEALEILRRAREIDADAMPLLKRLGLNSRQRGDLSSALAAFTRAWNQAPQDAELLGHLSATCLDLGLHDEAKHYYRQALKDNPQNIELWLGLARVARQLGDQETLEEATRQAANLNPGHPRLLELTQTRIPARDRAASPLPIQKSSGRGSGAARVPASIIIPVFNNLELTQNCLESIWEHTPPELYEIIVVDNGSSDGTPVFLKHLTAAGKIRHIPNEKNLGYAKACNQAARSARGDYLIMLNNDTVVTGGWLNALIEAVEKNDNLAIVGAKLLYPNDAVQHAGVAFNQKGKVYHIYRYFHRDHPAVNKTREFQVVTAACQLIRTSVFLQVGLFDEGFLNGFEDVDLCLRVGQLGYGILYNPDCVVYHLESMTPGRGADDSENSRYFTEKWQGRPMVPDDFRYYDEDGLRMEWKTDSEGGREAVIHDQNDNPYKQEARACLNQGDLSGAMAFYNLALRFNPFDPRNWALIAEMETLKDMAEPRSQAAHG
jgi:GT2 family glycosyltransferase/radical SAM superfamily enzyme YgiQ (UPF0313 family)/Tfp pilus assembly protein PilF